MASPKLELELNHKLSDFDDFTNEVMNSISSIKHSSPKASKERETTGDIWADMDNVDGHVDRLTGDRRHPSTSTPVSSISMMRKKECSFKGITTVHEVEDEEESAEDSNYSQDSPDYQEIDELLNFSKNIVESMSRTDMELYSNSPPSTPKDAKCFDSAFRYKNSFVKYKKIMFSFSSFSDHSSIFESESVKSKSIARSSAALELERETRENLSDSLDSITSISLESPINFEYKVCQ